MTNIPPSDSARSSSFFNRVPVSDDNRIAVLQVAVVSLAELLRQQHPERHLRWLECLQQTRDLPENLPFSTAFDELLEMIDTVAQEHGPARYSE